MLPDSAYNNHIIAHLKITTTDSPYNNHIIFYRSFNCNMTVIRTG